MFSLQTQECTGGDDHGFAISTLYHYILCNVFVFDSGGRYQRGAEISLVFLVSVIGLGWNLLLMWIFIAVHPQDCRRFRQKSARAIVTVWNYLSRKNGFLNKKKRGWGYGKRSVY